MKKIIGLIAVFASFGMATTNTATAQEATRAATVRLGGIMLDAEGDASRTMAGVGIDWTLSQHILAEVEGTFARYRSEYVDYVTAPNGFVRRTDTSLATLTAGVQAQALLGPVRPYVGLAAGLLVHYDEQPGADRFVNRTFAVPAGVRVDITDRFGLRAELRARFDSYQGGGSSVNVEQTAGITFRF